MIERLSSCLLRRVRCAIFLAPLLAPAGSGGAQVPTGHPADDSQYAPAEPAIPAILKALETYEVVAMPAAHGEKDMDDLILSLIRDPRFRATVNDIVVECGNSRYQPTLDRYIAGENVPFTEVEHVWRDTTVQQMCGASGFYEQLFPLVRRLNQRLPAASRLRVVAADPPIDWSKVRSYDDLTPFFDRDGSIASVMEAEVLSRHRKALMLFGFFHLLHGGGPAQGDAITRYERHYPGRTFVISDLGYYGAGDEQPAGVQLPVGGAPLLLPTKNSKLGALNLSAFVTPPIFTDEECNVTDAFDPSRPVAEQIDAFLYLGPPGTLLVEPLPADIALDRAYRSEWLRRMKLVGLPGPSTLEEADAQTIADAENPLLAPAGRNPVSQETRSKIRQDCLSHKQPAATTSK